MAIPRTVQDYKAAFQALMPRGRVWSRDPDSVQAQVVEALVPVYARSDARACYLLEDVFPKTTVETLPEWEATLGLPDPCGGPAQTVAERQAAVTAKLTHRGGQSVAYFVSLAAAHGYTVTIREYKPARFGAAKFGDPMRGAEWLYAWSVRSALGEVKVAKFGTARMGDRYREWANARLECQLREFAPAHTWLAFEYGDPTPPPPPVPVLLGVNFVLGRSRLS